MDVTSEMNHVFGHSVCGPFSPSFLSLYIPSELGNPGQDNWTVSDS